MPCPNCGTFNPTSHRFCSACGTPLPSEAEPRHPVPPRSERRLVSVMFADLVGFTSLAEGRDPEDVRALLTDYFDQARVAVESFGGVVDKFIGDAVMAVWGAVETHEDDAERAVRAALELVEVVAHLGDELSIPLRARVGVLTGEASVGPGGNERGLVVGDLVNTASRLQSMAEPGAVVVGESTYLAVGDAVVFEPLGEQPIRGRSGPVGAYRARRVGSARDIRPHGLELPFAGRDEELRLLKAALQEVIREGRARLVAIVGEPGVGKKRLAWELRKYADGISDTVLWHDGRSPSWGENAALWPVAEMVRGRVGIAETDGPAKARLKLRTAMADLVADERERLWVEPLIAGVLGLGDVPGDDRNELFAALRILFQRLTSVGTVVLAFADLHQAEQTTLDFIAELVERSPQYPILVITMARPEPFERRPDWDDGLALTVPVPPLSTEDMRGLVAGMLPGLPEGATRALIERAAGIPLYAVEFMRMLLASGEVVRDGEGFTLAGDLDQIAIPDSLQAVVGARLDRLGPASKRLLQDASVLGLTFFPDAVAAITGDDAADLEERLGELVNRELLALDEESTLPGGSRYRFTQGLTREVAYARLSRADRFSKHLAAAEHFESLNEIDLAAKVARHYLLAFETAPPDRATGLMGRACHALCSAAARAAQLQAHHQALRLWEQAIDITEAPTERAGIHESAAAAALRAGDYEQGLDHAAAAVDLYTETESADGRLRALTLQASLHLLYFHAPEAVGLLEPHLGTNEGSAGTRLTLQLEFARALMLNGDHERAASVADAALAEAQGVVGPGAIIDGIVTRATALAALGRTLEAAALLQGATDLADEHQLHSQAVRALNNLAVVVAADSPRRSGEIALEMLDRGRQFADSGWLYRMRNSVASKLLAEGRFDDALALLGEVELDKVPEFWRSMYRLTLATEETYRRPSNDAFARAREILGGWEGSTDPQMRSFVAAELASLDLREGDVASALARGTQPGEFEPNELIAGVAAAMWSGDGPTVRRALGHVEGLPMRGRFTEALHTLLVARLDALDGETDEAVAGFSAAIDVLDAVGTALDRAQARALFAAAVGVDRPEARAAGRAALEWIRSVGAVQLERAWAPGLPVDADEERLASSR